VNEISSFSSKQMELENIILREVSKVQKAKIYMFCLILDYRPKINAVILLDMGHTLKEYTHKSNREREGNLKLECGLCFHRRQANIVILKLQRPVWEGDQEVAKRSGRDQPMLVVIHMCMEATLEISLYSYLYIKVAKMLCHSYCLLCFLFNKIGERKGRTCSAWK
jgi:hypothetical protein